jgi:transposase
MIDYHRFCQIKHLHAHQGLNASQIAKELGLDPRTVSYWLAQEHFRPRKPRPHASKLEPFKAQMTRLLERYPYSAAQVFQRLREQGFDGGYSLVKAYITYGTLSGEPYPGTCRQATQWPVCTSRSSGITS